MLRTQEIISCFEYSDIVYKVKLLIRDQLNPINKFNLNIDTYTIDENNEKVLLAKLTISHENTNSDELCFNIEGIGNEVHGYTYLGYMVDVAKKYCNCIKSKYHHYSSDTWECIEEYEKFLMEGAKLCT